VRRLLLELIGVLGLAALCVLFTRTQAMSPFVFRGGLLWTDLASAAVIASVCAEGSVLGRAFSVRPLTWIGLRSYGLYLWHWPIFAITRPNLDLRLGEAHVLVFRLAVTALCAEISYRFVEGPVRKGALDASARRGSAAFSRSRRSTRSLVGLAGVGVVAALCVPALQSALQSTAGGEGAAQRSSKPSARAQTTPTTREVAETSAMIAGLQPRGAVSRILGPAERIGMDRARVGHGIPFDPHWPKTLTVLTDSVTLGTRRSLPAVLRDFHMEFVGRPALITRPRRFRGGRARCALVR